MLAPAINALAVASLCPEFPRARRCANQSHVKIDADRILVRRFTTGTWRSQKSCDADTAMWFDTTETKDTLRCPRRQDIQRRGDSEKVIPKPRFSRTGNPADRRQF